MHQPKLTLLIRDHNPTFNLNILSAKMPETPVLTKKQQKLSLSGKNKKPKQIIRNVLESPYASFWPVASESHGEQLEKLLRQHLPRIVAERVQIPWQELKKMDKSRRKLKSTCITSRDGLEFGINDCRKALDAKQALAILITEEVRPKLMVEHLISHCVLLKTPVIIMRNLRGVLKSCCGFTSAAFAITCNDLYGQIVDEIQEICKSYPVPENHINYQRSLEWDTTISIADGPAETVDVPVDDSFSYLVRNSVKERVFKPPVQDNVEKESVHDVLKFTKKKGPLFRNYKSMKVKRMKGDSGRVKRKIVKNKNKKPVAQ